jgi:ferredoxin-NADP reductase
MAEHIVKILEAEYVTHDVKRFVVERPKQYNFIPGQATDVSVNLPEWKDDLHPFTFTGLMEWKQLEFTIKIYNDRKGITDVLGRLNAGAELILHDVFGAIQYKGPGVFIAGGAGVTPFVAILRELFVHRQLQGNKLIFSNKTSEDVIYNDELTHMLGTDFIKVFTREQTIGFFSKRIDRDFIVETVKDFSQHFYVCGPDEFVTNIVDILKSVGASADTIVFEQ